MRTQIEEQQEDDIMRRARGRVGQTVRGKWRLDALLGVGGMAAVYSASHRNGNRIAVKWLHPALALDRKMRERFALEGYIANRVDHAGIVRVLDDEVAEDGSLVLFMELLDGETVDARWRRAGKTLPVLETVRIGHALLDVLVAAHAAGVVHRDLKPENLFLTRQGELKILDFGIARLREQSTATSTGSHSSLGTPAFMPPEQARGRWQDVDSRTDLWSVGATLFTLLTGRYVHLAETVNEQLLLAMTRPAPALASIVSTVPDVVAQIIDKALAFKPSERWSSAAEMREALADAFAKLNRGSVIAEAQLPGMTPREGVTPVAVGSTAILTTGHPVAVSLRGQTHAITTTAGRKLGRSAFAIAAALAIVAMGVGGAAFHSRASHAVTSLAPPSARTNLPPPAIAALPSATAAPSTIAPMTSEPSQPTASAAIPSPAKRVPTRKVAPVVRPTPTTDWHDRRE